MKNKYYTPDLSEFRIGFEYEENIGEKFIVNTFDGSISLARDSFYDDYGCAYESIESYIEYNLIRVKYLDKEDIKSFGFNHLYDDFTFGVFCKNRDEASNYKIDFDYNNKSISVGIYSDDDLTQVKDLFSGTIKNKSELGILLRQLNIINNGI